MSSSQTKVTDVSENVCASQITNTLRADNRCQLLEILSLHPTDTVGTQAVHVTNVLTGEPSSRISITHKQRLVFADASLRTLLLRHVLLEPASLDKAATKKRSKSTSLTAEEESWGIDTSNTWGIVGTRVLFPANSKDYDAALQSRLMREADGSWRNTNMSDPARKNVTLDSIQDTPQDDTDGAAVVVYFIRPDPSHIQAVAKSIRTQQKYTSNTNSSIKHRIVFIPHIHELAQRVLQDEGLVSISSSSHLIQPISTGLSIHALQIDWIPLDRDIITLTEHNSFLKEVDVLGVSSDAITLAAKSLVKLQDITGILPRIQSWGVLGEKILDKMMTLRVEDYHTQEFFLSEENINISGEDNDPQEPNNRHRYPSMSTHVGAMILIDRKIDWITPMLTPLTYEGLLDDILGIDCGFVHVDPHVIDPQSSDDTTDTSSTPEPLLSIPLNDLDSLYAEVRNQHVEKIGKFLQAQAKALKESHSTFTDKNKKDLSEIHQFVKQIPIFTKSVRLLTTHIHLAELIKKTTEQSQFRQRWQTEHSMLESESCYEVLEDLIALQYPPFRLLKLLCLQSLTCGGIKAARFDSLRRDIIQTYGYDFVFVLQNLEKLGLIKRKDSIFDSTPPFAAIRKYFSLILNDVDTSDPKDMAYVSSGYAPITARLIQYSITGFQGKEDALRELPGRGIDVLQSFPPEDLAAAMRKGSPEHPLGVWAKRFTSLRGTEIQGNPINKPILLVYLVGGVSFMEVAALRFLSTSPMFPYYIVILTTKLIDGTSLLQSLS